MKKAFDQAADPKSTWRREGLPDPAKLAGHGIRTRESLDWLSAREPSDPAPELHIDDPAIDGAARAAAQDEHRARINRMRAEFRSGAVKTQRDFGTARDYRGSEHER
ncbi:hypothetical protein RGUI_3556 [Rhodovulum sp. P5]|uniref:hypothetical protein n=1 Tax=Rhodovulum sp. P5 TaxID=1564506 RepID=UPI0009C26E84|nr:hypothetical protein [Rhodovulum sp. P5]ARE41697.1 hypothetical protein RGUI_3556 [Rhodovulum sp. P5]